MVSVVAALVVGAGVSTASATTSVDVTKCPPGYTSTEALCAAFLALARAAVSGDYTPRDMQVAAPSSVISATASADPALRVQEVNRWRPNPSAWLDAKERLAQTTGLTTEKIDATARWAPKLLKGLGVAGVLSGDSLINLVVRDGVAHPILEGVVGVTDARDTLRNTYCSRSGNFATDWVTGFVVDGCPEWRLKQDYVDLLATTLVGVPNCVQGWCFTYSGLLKSGTSNWVCAVQSVPSNSGSLPLPAPGGSFKFTYITDTGSKNTFISWPSHMSKSGTCRGGDTAFYIASNVFSLTGVEWTSPSGVKSSAVESRSEAAEWITKVRCLDGTSRFSVSDSFQQASLGAVPVPASVQLDGCKPVGVNVGVQKSGTGTTGAGGGWSSVPGGSRTEVGTSEVPTAVQDWQTAFPNCWDGSCRLDLKKVIGGSMELDCFDAPDQCVDWQTSVQADPQTYRCYYAGSVVAIAECNVYGRVFDRDKVQQGTGYSDPSTGTAVTTSTGTTVTTNPGAASTAMSSAVGDPSKPRQCFPSGWGAFNPFEWVLQPVKCALEWAFVPRESVFSSFRANVSGRFAQTSFGAVAGIVTAVNVPGVGDGCTGPPLSFKYGPIDETWYPFAACDAPMAGVAATIKLWLGFLISAGAVFAIIRYVTAIIGFIPYGGGGSGGGGRRGPKFEAVDE